MKTHRRLYLSTLVVAVGLAAYSSLPRGATAVATGAAPAPQGAGTPSVSPENRRAFYGDLHLHTTYSWDAWSWGTKVTPAMAYAFAKGEPVDVPAIQVRFEEGIQTTEDVTIQRDWPLDFMGVTDHASSLGVAAQFDFPDSPLGMSPEALEYRANPSHGGRGRGRAGGTAQDFEPTPAAFAQPAPEGRGGRGRGGGRGGGTPVDQAAEARWKDRVWRESIEAANEANEPGVFTAFIAYEWTSNRGGWIHRNVIFSGDNAPAPFSAAQSRRPEDLWTYLEVVRSGGQDVLAIPHNSNYNNSGFMFDWNNSEGDPIDQAYAQRRDFNEPLVEIGQNKGTSETSPGLSPNDEFANFEIMDSVRNSTNGGKYVRQAYGRGLVIESAVGANPYKMGIVGGSDIHNGLSTSDEKAFAGGHFGVDDPIYPSGNYARNTLGLPTVGPDGPTERGPDGDANILWAPGSLTGVWAEENTRESIFAAFRRKETFATSGTRLRVRMFGGWSFSDQLLQDSNWVAEGYRQGVPMGGDLPARPAEAEAPVFVLQAMKDPDGANLDRIQVIKVWVDGDRSMERVFDVAVSDGRAIDWTGRAKAVVGNTVNLQTGEYANTIGDATLSAVWRDPDFDPAQAAVYYARVIEIPTPRWSTLLAIRNGLPLTTAVPATIQERGWSSPIWYKPSAP